MASYFQTPAGMNHIPNFVSARTENGLRRAMLINSKNNLGFVVYQDIQWIESKNKWFAWYYVKIEKKELEELLGGSDG